MCPGLGPSNHLNTHLIEAFETKELKRILKQNGQRNLHKILDSKTPQRLMHENICCLQCLFSIIVDLS